MPHSLILAAQTEFTDESRLFNARAPRRASVKLAKVPSNLVTLSSWTDSRRYLVLWDRFYRNSRVDVRRCTADKTRCDVCYRIRM